MALRVGMNRRAFLAAGVSLGVAGCTGSGSTTETEASRTTSTPSPDDDATSPSTTGDAATSMFTHVGFEGATLVVELAEQAASDVQAVRIDVVDGGRAGRLDFSGDTTRATMEVEDTVRETWRFVALYKGQEVGSVTKEFAPQLTVTDVTRVAETTGLSMTVSEAWNRVEYGPLSGVGGYVTELQENPKLARRFTRAAIHFTNTGNAPIVLKGTPQITSGTLIHYATAKRDDSTTLLKPNESTTLAADPGYEFLMRLRKRDGTWRYQDPFNTDRIVVQQAGEEFTGDHVCTGDPRDLTIVIWDDTGTQHEQTASIRFAGRLVRLGASSDGELRTYTCEQIDVTL